MLMARPDNLRHKSSDKICMYLANLTTQGRDTESQVLARAVKWHSEHRVLLNGHKTVIFK